MWHHHNYFCESNEKKVLLVNELVHFEHIDEYRDSRKAFRRNYQWTKSQQALKLWQG